MTWRSGESDAPAVGRRQEFRSLGEMTEIAHSPLHDEMGDTDGKMGRNKVVGLRSELRTHGDVEYLELGSVLCKRNQSMDAQCWLVTSLHDQTLQLTVLQVVECSITELVAL